MSHRPSSIIPVRSTVPPQRSLPLRSLVTLAFLVGGVSNVVAQSVRDSAGVTIVTNGRPAWNERQAFRLDTTPTLVIGDHGEGAYLLPRIGAVVRLVDGTIVAGSGDGGEIRRFDSSGAFLGTVSLPGMGANSSRGITALVRMPADSIGVVTAREVAFLAPDQSIARTVPNPIRFLAPLSWTLALLPDGLRVIAQFHPLPLRPAGTHWVDSIPFFLVPSNDTTPIALGALPAAERAMDGETPHQLWFGPVASWATTTGRLYYGYPAEYAIRVFGSDGRLTRLIRRRWSPLRITEADKDAHTVEWGKHWITATGAEGEAEHADHRDDPYAATVPAFSQMIVDEVGRLWVREAHLRDPDLVGEFFTTPVVPSTWSVFDTEGRWLCDVSMPAGFLPKAIGRDYVLGVAGGGEVRRTITLYRYSGGARVAR